MITTFPSFTKLELSHKEEIQSLTWGFDPYSDFNFTSLFCWNTNNSTEISMLNGNLVIKMPDYITGKPIYSIIGDKRIDDSLNSLLQTSPTLSLVPQVAVDHIESKDRFIIAEDRDNFDYVYSLEKQSDFNGHEFKYKRKRVGRFLRTNYEDLRINKIRFSLSTDRDLVKSAFRDWANDRSRNDAEIDHEKKAINKLLDNCNELELMGIKVIMGDKTVGFSINEVVQKDYAICHFQKAIVSYDHLDVFISNVVAKELKHFGCKYVNWEQDLGIPGLRESKTSYSYDFFLKKYSVRLR